MLCIADRSNRDVGHPESLSVVDFPLKLSVQRLDSEEDEGVGKTPMWILDQLFSSLKASLGFGTKRDLLKIHKRDENWTNEDIVGNFVQNNLTKVYHPSSSAPLSRKLLACLMNMPESRQEELLNILQEYKDVLGKKTKKNPLESPENISEDLIADMVVKEYAERDNNNNNNNPNERNKNKSFFHQFVNENLEAFTK